MTDTKYLRNFSIIAHIDHGKSTLSDQLLLKTGAISQRDFRNQVLDDMDLERERGITIRMHPVTVHYTYKGRRYELNLIDTPGHVDFNYEVSRSLAACEGAILLVDASQGVQAQTVANAYLAIEHDLTIVPVLNKVDLAIARPDEVIAEMEQAVGIKADEVLRVSGKTGAGVDELFAAIIERIPPPPGDAAAPLKALVYNSHFDTFKGVVVYIRIMDGVLKKGQRIRLMRGQTEYEAAEMGQFRPARRPSRNCRPARSATSWPRSKTSARSTSATPSRTPPIPPPRRWPATRSQSQWSSAACTRWTITTSRICARPWATRLNDSSFSFQPEVSEGLGFGFRCGFLGMLHREIIQQRLERDSELELVQTAPNVTYEVLTRKGELLTIDNPQKAPDAGQIKEFREPIVHINFLLPASNIGDLMKLCSERRGIYVRTEYLSPTRPSSSTRCRWRKSFTTCTTSSSQ